MTGPTQAFWQERFEKQETRWDRGAPSPQLLAVPLTRPTQP